MKQVIVMRNDLNMRKGKMVAQGAHASIAFIFNRDISVEAFPGNSDIVSIEFENSWAIVRAWLLEGMPKICVRAESENELLQLVAKAKELGLLAYTVVDAGKTEFNGVPTLTCVAIGPGHDELVNQVTGHLKLL